MMVYRAVYILSRHTDNDVAALSLGYFRKGQIEELEQNFVVSMTKSFCGDKSSYNTRIKKPLFSAILILSSER